MRVLRWLCWEQDGKKAKFSFAKVHQSPEDIAQAHALTRDALLVKLFGWWACHGPRRNPWPSL
jgi:hypothetical protein